MRTIPIVLCALSILFFSGRGRPANQTTEQPAIPEPKPAAEIAQTYVPGWYSNGHRVLQMPPTTLPTTDAEGSPVLAPDVPVTFHRYDWFLLRQ
jgi:hypothetical protein